MGGHGVGIGRDQVSSMLQSFLTPLGVQPVHQDMEQRGSPPPRSFTICQKPGFEVLMVDDLQTFQQLSAKLCGQIEEMFGGQSIRTASCEFPSNFENINRGILSIKEYVITIGNDPLVAGIVNK